VTRKVWDGRADLEEFELTARQATSRYDPASIRSPTPTSGVSIGPLARAVRGQPTIGRIQERTRRNFSTTEPSGTEWQIHPGSICSVDITPNSGALWSSRSRDDGGKTWESLDHGQTRVKEESGKSALELRTNGQTTAQSNGPRSRMLDLSGHQISMPNLPSNSQIDIYLFLTRF